MPFKSTVKLDSKLFDKNSRAKAFAGVVSRSSKDFKESTRRKMVDANPTGNVVIYEDENSRGRGFSRRFRRSRRGERPAPETLTLINAIRQRKTGDLSAIVDISDKINPRNGEKASAYAEKLQNDLDRKIMTKEDLDEADKNFFDRSQAILKKLL